MNSNSIVDSYINRGPVSFKDGQSIDRLTEQLFHEFDEHCRELQKTNPTYTDRHELFLGWAMQKLAAISYVVLGNSGDIAALKDNR
jgi:hypothetical protein